MSRKKKPEGHEQLQKLLVNIARIPKSVLDREVAKHKKKAAVKKKRA